MDHHKALLPLFNGISISDKAAIAFNELLERDDLTEVAKQNSGLISLLIALLGNSPKTKHHEIAAKAISNKELFYLLLKDEQSHWLLDKDSGERERVIFEGAFIPPFYETKSKEIWSAIQNHFKGITVNQTIIVNLPERFWHWETESVVDAMKVDIAHLVAIGYVEYNSRYGGKLRDDHAARYGHFRYGYFGAPEILKVIETFSPQVSFELLNCAQGFKTAVGTLCEDGRRAAQKSIVRILQKMDSFSREELITPLYLSHAIHRYPIIKNYYESNALYEKLAFAR